MERSVSWKKILLFMIFSTKSGLHLQSKTSIKEQHTRAATYVKVLEEMECTYWTYSINHNILHWGMTF